MGRPLRVLAGGVAAGLPSGLALRPSCKGPSAGVTAQARPEAGDPHGVAFAGGIMADGGYLYAYGHFVRISYP